MLDPFSVVTGTGFSASVAGVALAAGAEPVVADVDGVAVEGDEGGAATGWQPISVSVNVQKIAATAALNETGIGKLCLEEGMQVESNVGLHRGVQRAFYKGGATLGLRNPLNGGLPTIATLWNPPPAASVEWTSQRTAARI